MSGQAKSLGIEGDSWPDAIEDLEESFRISFTDEEIRNCSTVGDLFAIVEARLSDIQFGERCATTMSFYRLRRALQSHSSVPLRPGTPIAALGATPVRILHDVVERDCGLRSPAYIMPLWCRIAMSLCWALSLFFLVSLLFSPSFEGFGIFLALVFCQIAVGLVAPYQHPNAVSTFGDFARFVVYRNVGCLAEQGARFRSREAWMAFTNILAEYASLPEDRIAADIPLS